MGTESIDPEQKTTEKKPLILIADDQPMNQKIISMFLEKMGYDSILADDGEEALEKTLALDPALVFMDVQMPKMDGYEATKCLRGKGFKKPIIVVTASTISEEQENCRNAGVDDVLTKPFKQSDILNIIQKWINLRPEARQDHLPVEAPHEASSERAAFNTAVVLANFMNNEKAILALLPRFIEHTRSLLENIPALKEAGDWESLRMHAHTIRGSAFSMGGEELGAEAAVLEQACKNRSGGELDASYPRILKIFLNYKKEAEEFLLSRE